MIVKKFLCLIVFLISGLIFGQNHVLHLDGDGDYVSLPTAIIDSDEFTIEAWANILGDGGGYEGQNSLFTQRDYETGGGHSAIHFSAHSPMSGYVSKFNVRSTDGPNDIVEHDAQPNGGWHHYAGVVRQDSIFLYIDGILVDAGLNNQTGSYDAGIDLTEIGRHYHADDYFAGFFNGFIDEMRIWQGALSHEDILDAKANYLFSIPVPLLAHWDFETSEILDISLNNHNGILHDDAHVVEFELNQEDFGLSLFLDGEDDYAELLNPAIHLTSYTIEVWAAMIGTGGGLEQQNSLFTQRDYSTGANHCSILLNAENYPAGSISRWNIRSNSGSEDMIDSPSPNYGEWHHYAGVVSENTISLYIDGSLVSVGENNQAGVYDVSIDHVDIGRHYHASSYLAGVFYGYIDELKIWSTARSMLQILQDMNQGAPINDAGLVGYYNFENGWIEDLSPEANHGTVNNGATIVHANYSPNLGFILGDANGDGFLDIFDLQILINFIVGLDDGNFDQIVVDLSEDGLVNILDVVLLVQNLLEL